LRFTRRYAPSTFAGRRTILRQQAHPRGFATVPAEFAVVTLPAAGVDTVALPSSAA
jgi:hypothetical protein